MSITLTFKRIFIYLLLALGTAACGSDSGGDAGTSSTTSAGGLTWGQDNWNEKNWN